MGHMLARMFCLFALSSGAFSVLAAPARLKVSENKHFLVKDDGEPFFYLGDTAWELFHRLNREEADRYLADRAAKRFTVIQAVVLAELNSLDAPNAYGALPLVDHDPTRPNEAYFQQVDYVVKKAEVLGLYVGMLPTWGDKVGDTAHSHDSAEIFTPDSARVYGEFLGRRYRNSPIIWILGGDRQPNTEMKRAIWRAMAKGLRAGDGGNHLITFHPPGGSSSAEWLHGEEWLDFNMMQNGHNTDTDVWNRVGKDYARNPTKPVVDGEPLYEDHPIAFNARERGYSNAADVRKFAYWDVFSGACGYTYGNHSIWQMNKPGKEPINGPLNYWYDALDHPGAQQTQHLRALVESRPYLNRIPDQSLLASEPSAGGKHIQATRASDGSYAFVYIPASRAFAVHMDKIAGNKAQAWWFNPRTGIASRIGEFSHVGASIREFTPKDVGENVDWVLVIDNATSNFVTPGKRK